MALNPTLLWLSVALALAACNRQTVDPHGAEARAPAHVAASSVDVARLTADRAALDEAHARCKARSADATPELCAAAAEATRRRFSGSTGAYVPAPVEPFPSERR